MEERNERRRQVQAPLVATGSDWFANPFAGMRRAPTEKQGRRLDIAERLEA